MIKNVQLIRVVTGEDGTFGTWVVDGAAWCVTLEPPDNNNLPNISCIPAGRYRCKIVNSPRYGLVYEVTGVEGRTHILIHPGNIVADTKGCVMLGRHFGVVSGKRAVQSSGKTVQAFNEMAEGVEFDLDIINAWEAA